jgi:hypothetical protein
MSQELKGTLTEAIHEIQSLRRRNEVLSAKVEMIDLFACVLHSKPAERTNGASVDIAWFLQKEVDRLDKEEKEKGQSA